MKDDKKIEKISSDFYGYYIAFSSIIPIEEFAKTGIKSTIELIKEHNDEGFNYASYVIENMDAGWRVFCDKAKISDQKELFMEMFRKTAPDFMNSLDDYKSEVAKIMEKVNENLKEFGIKLYQEK